MMAHEPRSLGYYGASRWFQGAVLFVMLGALALGLLWALADAKERAEKLVVELTVRNMRSGMQLAMGEALMQQRANEIATWVGNNPVLWLGSPPDGYRGECSAAESRDLDGGAWCFERDSRQLGVPAAQCRSPARGGEWRSVRPVVLARRARSGECGQRRFCRPAYRAGAVLPMGFAVKLKKVVHKRRVSPL